MKWLILGMALLASAYGNFSQATLAQLDQAFDQAYSQNGLVGIIAGVWVGDQQIWVRTKGFVAAH